jgi:hypothetical protein
VKISSPIGEYEYRVERVRFHGRRLEVQGSLGQWETTTSFDARDLRKLLRKSMFPLMVASGLVVVTRRLKRV